MSRPISRESVNECTVKTFGLLQPYFGHLSCMLVVCVTHYKLQKDASNLNQSLRVIEKLLPQLRSSYRKPIGIWLHISQTYQ